MSHQLKPDSQMSSAETADCRLQGANAKHINTSRRTECGSGLRLFPLCEVWHLGLLGKYLWIHTKYAVSDVCVSESAACVHFVGLNCGIVTQFTTMQ